MQFHVKGPIFVARQLVKHQVGLVWNEVSRRYVDDEPEFYIPKNWRLKVEDKKQGSSNETIEYNIDGSIMFVKQTYDNLLQDWSCTRDGENGFTTKFIHRVVLVWNINGICKSM